VVGAWRDRTLSRPKMVKSDDAGEDFFYIQEVRLSPQ
jgi:protein phosphatase PTC7